MRNILEAFNALAKYARANALEETPDGIGGMWTPDSERKGTDVIWRSYSGGYENQVVAPSFGVEIWTCFTQGNVVPKLTRGTMADVERLLEHLNL